VSTPYQDFGDKNVVKFFEEIGVQVLRIALLKCGSATDIAHVPEDWCEKVIRGNLVHEGVEAIAQCGTNLSMVSLSDRLEREWGIPIIPIYAACLWFWMHEVGIDAKLQTAYETLIPDSNKSIAAKSEVIAEKIAEMGMKDEARVTARCDMKGVMVDLESLNNVNRQTHRDCDFVLTNFDVRQDSCIARKLVAPKILSRNDKPYTEGYDIAYLIVVLYVMLAGEPPLGQHTTRRGDPGADQEGEVRLRRDARGDERACDRPDQEHDPGKAWEAVLRNGQHARSVDSDELDVEVTSRQDSFSLFKNQTGYNMRDVK